MSNKANLSIFKGEKAVFIARPKDVTVSLTGWAATVTVCQSTRDGTSVALGTTVLLDNRQILCTLETQGLQSTHSADDLEGQPLQGYDNVQGSCIPYAYYVRLTAPSGQAITLAWGHLYILERT